VGFPSVALFEACGCLWHGQTYLSPPSLLSPFFGLEGPPNLFINLCTQARMHALVRSADQHALGNFIHA
jgi:hypothetical protein